MIRPLVKTAGGEESGALTDRVLASESLRRSPRLRALFRYLAERSLSGERELLSEQQIGMAVFGRSPGYNATDDSVVRVQVHNLRERLAEYFVGEGTAEPLVATIPKGSYYLVFGHRSGTAAPEPEMPPTSADAPGQRRPHSLVWTVIPISLLAFALGVGARSIWMMSGIGSAKAAPTIQEVAPNLVLGSLFTPANPPIVVIEDTMLVLAAMMRGQPFSLAEFVAAGGRPPDLSGVFTSDLVRSRVESLLSRSRYVNLANVTFATQLLRSYPRLSERAVFRHPREIQMREIRSSNCIFFGGILSDPWVELYEDSLNFHLRPFTAGSGFENRRPKLGERPSYGDTQAGDTRTYARIALLPNFEAGTRALILTGMGGPETEAAAQFLFAPNFFDQLPAQLRSQLHRIPSHLEILISASRVGAAVGRTQVVAWRASEEAGPPSGNR